MLRVFSGPYCCSVDEKPAGFVWSVALADPSGDERSIVEGIAADMDQAVRALYSALETVMRESISEQATS
jgi:hypothetical protein